MKKGCGAGQRKLPLALFHLRQTISKCNPPALNNVTVMGAPMRQYATHNLNA
jgi:hypothetical protein